MLFKKICCVRQIAQQNIRAQIATCQHSYLRPCAHQVVRTPIDVSTTMDFGSGTAVEVIGYQYNVTFYCANGNVPTLGCNTSGTSPFTSTNPDMNDLTPPEGRQCQVTDEIDGSFVSGEFTLSTSYPHVKEGIPLWNYTTAPLSWRATADEVDTALEAVRDPDGARAFGAVTVARHVFWPEGEYKWSGQYNWSITFDTRPGDVPEMRSNSTMVSNAGDVAEVSVGTARFGNEIDGGYGLSFCPNGGDCTTTNSTYFSSFLTEDELKYRFSEAFFTRGSAAVNVSGAFGAAEVRVSYAENGTAAIEVSDWLRLDGSDYVVESVSDDPTVGSYDHLVQLSANVEALEGYYNASFGTTAVSVTRTGPTQAMGYSWEVTFSNKTVGGNQPDIESQSSDLTGSGADIVISETQQGNQLTGTFTLSYDGTPALRLPNIHGWVSRGITQTSIQTLRCVAA